MISFINCHLRIIDLNHWMQYTSKYKYQPLIRIIIQIITAMEGENQECTNCFKPFPIDRIDLHEAYCSRNIRKCKLCQKMVDIKDQEQHDKQFHQQKECPLCNLMIEPALFINHQDLCPRRPALCKYCENNWPQVEITKHIDSCGARTKPCTICHKNIMLKDWDEHSSRCERREPRAEVSQDHQPRGHRRNDRVNDQRSRQNSTNNMREPIKSNSNNKIIRPNVFKPSNIIGPEIIRAVIDPVPISVRIAIKNQNRQNQPRIPLKSKN